MREPCAAFVRESLVAESRIGYRMVEASKPDDGETLCGAQASNDLRTQLGLKVTTGLASPSSGDDVVIPITSELYSSEGQPIAISKDWRLKTRSWLNLACAHDALAKRSLYQLHTDSLERTRAALRMLTANYCGFKPFTMRGMEVTWLGGAREQLEAQWSGAGATCLETPRVIYRDAAAPQNVPDYLPVELKKICGPKGRDECPDLPTWITAAHQCIRGSQVKTIDRCTASVTSPREFKPVESFVELPTQARQP